MSTARLGDDRSGEEVHLASVSMMMALHKKTAGAGDA